MKLELKDEVIAGITWKNVRDAFKYICFMDFTVEELVEELVIQIYKNEIIKTINDKHKTYKPNIAHIRGMFSGLRDKMSDKNSYLGHIEKFKKVDDLIIILEKYSLIECSEKKGNWKISKEGHTLRMQKAIRRITRSKAIEYLKKIIHNIDEYNLKVGCCYRIEALWGYGSLVSDSADLGDLDLSVKISKKYNVDETYDEWSKRELNRHVYLGLVPDKKNHKSRNEALKIVKISPYVSLADYSWLHKSIKEGDARAVLIWKNNYIDMENEKNIMNELLNLPVFNWRI